MDVLAGPVRPPLVAPRPRRSLRPAKSTPTPYDLRELRRLTRRVVGEVRTGRHEVIVDPDRRWYRMLATDGYCDVWLISWATEQMTELHDHGGSIGALTVVTGSLIESRWTSMGDLRTRTLRQERGAAFPLGHVHDVANLSGAPAISVHAYSPPLSAMSYYDVETDGGGRRRLRRSRTELVEPSQEAG